MDYFQDVVIEFLRSRRSQFVNAEYLINLDLDGTYLKGRHWYCDAVAIDFETSTVYLCEITYSKTLYSITNRLRAWQKHWPAVVEAIHRDSSLRGQWLVVPRIFVPETLKSLLESKISVVIGNSEASMPHPLITPFEQVLPWKYRSWNGEAFVESGGA